MLVVGDDGRLESRKKGVNKTETGDDGRLSLCCFDEKAREPLISEEGSGSGFMGEVIGLMGFLSRR